MTTSLVTVPNGERTITYNADDQATRIHKAGVQQVDFGYGISGRIWRQDTKKGDVPHDPNDATKGLADNENRITYYHGALETVVTTSGDNPGTIKRYTLGNIVLTYFANTQQWQKRVLVKDNQGSTMAVADQQTVVNAPIEASANASVVGSNIASSVVKTTCNKTGKEC